MVEYRSSPAGSAVEAPNLDGVFRALADPTRRAILRRLAAGEETVSSLSAPFSMSLAAVSKHLKTLERAGLVERSVSGREHYLRLRPEALAPAQEWLAFYQRFWGERLDALEELIVSAEREGGDERKPDGGQRSRSRKRTSKETRR